MSPRRRPSQGPPPPRWIVALAYLQPDHTGRLWFEIRPRLAVLDTQDGGRIWVGKDTPRAQAQAAQLAKHLNAQPARSRREALR